MFDFLLLRGTNRSFVKPICLIDTSAFDFSSRGLKDWFAMLALTKFVIFFKSISQLVIARHEAICWNGAKEFEVFFP
jgi:hypothetical protein